jgi:hypothetical protein
MMRFLAGWTAILLVVACAANGIGAHPFHVCVGQMEWNEEKQHWEVSLRVHPQDLERAVAQAQRKPCSIDDSHFSEQVIPFLNKQFAIVDLPASKSVSEVIVAMDSMDSEESPPPQSELRWVGMESERGWLWIHLEMIPPNKIAPDHPAWLVHRIFLGTIDRQENSVRIIHGTNRYSLQFLRDKEAQTMKTDTVASKDSSRIPRDSLNR